MRGERVAVRVAPRPVLSGDRELGLDLLVVWPQVPIVDRPVDTHSVIGCGGEVGGVEAGRVARVVDHRSADAAAGVVLPELDRVVAADDALLRPVELVRAGLV